MPTAKRVALICGIAALVVAALLAAAFPTAGRSPVGRLIQQAVPTVPTSFAFPRDGTGQLLAAVLTPPAQLPLAEPPPAEPQPWQRVGAESLPPRKDELLALAEVPQSPRLLAVDRGGVRVLHRSLDAPPLYLSSEPVPPNRTWLPYGNLAYATRPRADAAPPLEVHPRPWEPPLLGTAGAGLTGGSLQREAFAEVVRPLPAMPPAQAVGSAVLAASAEGSPPSAEASRAIALLPAPADNDPPAGSSAALPRPMLPVDAAN